MTEIPRGGARRSFFPPLSESEKAVIAENRERELESLLWGWLDFYEKVFGLTCDFPTEDPESFYFDEWSVLMPSGLTDVAITRRFEEVFSSPSPSHALKHERIPGSESYIYRGFGTDGRTLPETLILVLKEYAPLGRSTLSQCPKGRDMCKNEPIMIGCDDKVIDIWPEHYAAPASVTDDGHYYSIDVIHNRHKLGARLAIELKRLDERSTGW